MANKKSAAPKNDFDYEEDLDICTFTDEPVINGECISSFSFQDSSSSKNTTPVNIKTDNNIKADNNASSSSRINPSDNASLSSNRKTPLANGMTPPIDGELLDTKRTYMLRTSTVRKLNELKSIHPEINTYVSTIVDMAITHYYNHIINKGGIQ